VIEARYEVGHAKLREYDAVHNVNQCRHARSQSDSLGQQDTGLRDVIVLGLEVVADFEAPVVNDAALQRLGSVIRFAPNSVERKG
jgi:hypothetical protein